MKKKEKIVVNNDNEKVEENYEPIENVGLLEAGAGFVKPDLVEEGDIKAEILQYPDEVASPEVKQALIKAEERAEKIMKPTDGGDNLPNAKKSNRQEMEKELQTNTTTKENEHKEESEQTNEQKKQEDNEKII